MTHVIKRFGALVAATALATTALVGAFALPASATPEVCTPVAAQTIEHPAVGEPTITVENPDYVPEKTEEVFDHFQRYSWTGGSHTEDSAPAFPGSGWQANTESDPHGVGKAGAYYRSNGNSGNGDWFYLEAVNKTVVTPPVGTPTITKENPDYKAPWTETIPGKECPPVETPRTTVQACTSYGTVHTTDLSTWYLGDTRATGHNELVEGGLHVYTEGATATDKAAGYIAANFALKNAGTDFGISATNVSGGFPGLQFAVDLDNDGDREGYLVHEPVYGAQTLWLSANWGNADLTGAPTSVNGGGTGKGGPINAWLDEYPNAQVSAIGYSLGSGVKGDLVITNIAAGCTNYTFGLAPAPEPILPSCTTVTDEQVIPGDGAISVPGNWESATIPVPFYGAYLKDIGTVLDIQADPIQYVGLHIHLGEASIVFEEEPSYEGKLWSNATFDGIPAGMGYNAFASIEDFIALYGDRAVTGIDLLYTHPEASETTVESFTIGCTVYTFAPEVTEPPVDPEPEYPVTPPVTETPAPTPTATPAPTVQDGELAATGSDSSPLPWVLGGVFLLAAGGLLLGFRKKLFPSKSE